MYFEGIKGFCRTEQSWAKQQTEFAVRREVVTAT
jgi:hypothetical protein